MARRRQYRGSGPSGGYTERERDAVPTSMFLKPQTRTWPVGDRRHVTIALQYMQRGFGNRSEYAQLLARLLTIWPPAEHPDVLEEVAQKLPAIAEVMDGRRARRNPTPVEAEVQRMLNNPPPSWEAMMGQYGLQPGVSPEKFFGTILEFTPSMSKYGEKGRSGHVPPAAVRKAALLGLRLSFENNYTSASGIGVARAVQLVIAPNVWDRTITRMNAYFLRHRKDQQARRFGDIDDPSRGYMAWLNWGGTPGWDWSRQKLGLAKMNPRRRSRAKLNPEAYSPDVEAYIARTAVLNAAIAAIGSGRKSSEAKLKSFRELVEALDRMSEKRGKRRTLGMVVERWARTNLRANAQRDLFRAVLGREVQKLRRNLRGIMAFPEDQRSELMRHVSSVKKPLIELFGHHRDYNREFLYGVEEEAAEEDVEARDIRHPDPKGRRRKAVELLGWTRLEPEQHGEPTNWVCAAEPDEERCASTILNEYVSRPPEEADDDYTEGDYSIGVQHVRDPLWWYDLNVMPYASREQVRQRLGAEWVHMANRHKSRRFYGDIAAHPSATLDWLAERSPSRKAVEKSLRKFVATLPVKHDYSARHTPRWIERLKGHHAENENEVKAIGKRYGWCFGGVHSAMYLSVIDDDHELYFATVKGLPTAIFIKRGTSGQSYDPDYNRWLSAKVYQDEIGPFALIEAKYPQNVEAIKDVRRSLAKMKYEPSHGKPRQ